ncbi:hypothetical protein AgCh_011336 [Apium graveolens]
MANNPQAPTGQTLRPPQVGPMGSQNYGLPYPMQFRPMAPALQGQHPMPVSSAAQQFSPAGQVMNSGEGKLLQYSHPMQHLQSNPRHPGPNSPAQATRMPCLQQNMAYPRVSLSSSNTCAAPFGQPQPQYTMYTVSQSQSALHQQFPAGHVADQPWLPYGNQGSSPGPFAVVNSPHISSVWQEFKSSDGNRYYYNKITKQSCWEKPLDSMTPLEFRPMAPAPQGQHPMPVSSAAQQFSPAGQVMHPGEGKLLRYPQPMQHFQSRPRHPGPNSPAQATRMPCLQQNMSYPRVSLSSSNTPQPQYTMYTVSQSQSALHQQFPAGHVADQPWLPYGSQGSSPGPFAVVNSPHTSSVWQEFESGDGKRYYHNKVTKQSCWEKPLELKQHLEYSQPVQPMQELQSRPLQPGPVAPAQARDSDYWGEKAREWVAAQESDASIPSLDDDYSALLAGGDIVFPLEVPIRPWMRSELGRMSNINSSTTKKKVPVKVLLKILGLLDCFNPDVSPHKYDVSPSKLVPAMSPLPPLPRSALSDSKRHRSSPGSGERQIRPKLGEG